VEIGEGGGLCPLGLPMVSFITTLKLFNHGNFQFPLPLGKGFRPNLPYWALAENRRFMFG